MGTADDQEKPTEETNPPSIQDFQGCSSCIERPNCQDDLKDNTSSCSKWHTKIVELYDGQKVAFECVPNKILSSWQTRLELEEPEAMEKVAKELHVRPKTVWLLLLGDSDRIPRLSLPTDCPTFDLTDPTRIDKQEIRYRVGHWLLDNYYFLAFQDQPNELYLYNQELGVYEPGKGEVLVAAAVRHALEKYATTYDVNEVKALIRDAKVTDRSVLRLEEPLVCCANGVLNILTSELTPHTPNKVFLQRIPVAFDSAATCPNVDAFHEQVVDRGKVSANSTSKLVIPGSNPGDRTTPDVSHEQDDVQTLLEIIGYCLYPGYPFHKAFMLNGDGSNGKSTWLNIVKTLLGPENCSNISLQELENNRFAKAALVGKLANIYADLTSAALKHTGVFKQLVGGDRIGAEYKFGKHFSYDPTVKHLFSANTVPESPDDTGAYFRRWMIVNFPKIFTSFSEPKADPHILTKLTMPQELSGLLNKSLKALRELLERGYFHGDRPTAGWRQEYIRKSDPVHAFVMDALEEKPNPTLFITKSDLFRAFVWYCIKNKLPPMDGNVFSRKIKLYFAMAYESKPGKRSEKRKQGWCNLDWNEDFKKEWDESVKGQVTRLDGWQEEEEET
jgi:putative DNA primase/helicase